MPRSSYELVENFENARPKGALEYRHSIYRDTSRTLSPKPVRREQNHLPALTKHALVDWWPEACIVLLAVVALLAAIAVLRSFQNQSLPKWPTYLSLNTVISLFVVVIKSCLAAVLAEGIGQAKWIWFQSPRLLHDLRVFDEASRGPWGSAQLLTTSHFKHKTASLGALLTCLLFITDPFTQQLLHYYSCDQDLGQREPILLKTQMYSENEGHQGATPGMISAINSGLFSPGQFRNTISCSTGNCTIPDTYSTIGFCSRCENLSDSITITKSNPEQYGNNSMITRVTNTTLPSGLTATWDAQIMSSVLFRASAIPNNSSRTLEVEMLLGSGGSAPVGRRTGQFAGCSHDPSSSEWRCKGYGGSTCRIEPCVLSYTGEIKGGNLTEKLTGFTTNMTIVSVDYPELEDDETFYTSTDTECLTDDQATALNDVLGYPTKGHIPWLAIPVAVNRKNGTVVSELSSNMAAAAKIVPSSCIYQARTATITGIISYLALYLDGMVDLQSALGTSTRANSSNAVPFFYNSGNVTYDAVSGSFDSITEAMTRYMRQNGDSASSNAVLGTVRKTESCVAVRWEWLSYPTILVCLTIVFFAFMVKQSIQGFDATAGLGLEPNRASQSTRHVFKSSILPVLFFSGFSDRYRRQDGTLDQTCNSRQMVEEAKTVQAQMIMTERGWKLIPISKS